MTAALLANLVFGVAGATIFYRALYSLSSPWLESALVDDKILGTFIWELWQIVEKICFIVLWVVSGTACVWWTAYTLVAIWEIHVPCSPAPSGAKAHPSTNETDIDLEAQVGCTRQGPERFTEMCTYTIIPNTLAAEKIVANKATPFLQ